MLIDVMILLALMLLILSGYRKGLLLSLMGLLVAVLCCLGATAAQNALTPQAASYLEPRLAEMLRPSVQAELDRSAQSAIDSAGDAGFTVAGQTMSLSDLLEFLRQFGLDVEGTVAQGAADAVAPVAEAVTAAVAHALAEKLAGAAIFLAAFLILYLVLHSAALAVNLVDRLPVIHTCNRLGGAVLGAAEWTLVMVVAAAVCLRANLLPTDPGPVTELLIQLSEQLL